MVLKMTKPSVFIGHHPSLDEIEPWAGLKALNWQRPNPLYDHTSQTMSAI
jgi:hypothetical protein